MAKSRKKPRVLLTTSRFRVSIDALGFSHLEVHDGYDKIGTRRWCAPDHAQVTFLVQLLVSDLSHALQQRAQRRSKARG